MHRSLLITAFVLLLAAMPLSAQHGGGHASAGGHGGFSSRGSFSGGGSHAFSGAHSSSGFAGHSFAGASSFSGSRSRAFGRSGSARNGLRIGTYGLRNCSGYGCRGLYGYGYPWAYGFDPYWWWDSGSSYDQDQQDQIGLAQEMNQQNLAEQQMRGQNDQGDQNVYARSPSPPPHQEERTEALPSTVLVFRDQHQQEVQNYAIVGQTLWIFAPQRTQKVPLSDLDLPTTTKANDDRGVDFHVPGGREGQ
jgi:hypothetical protein